METIITILGFLLSCVSLYAAILFINNKDLNEKYNCLKAKHEYERRHHANNRDN